MIRWGCSGRVCAYALTLAVAIGADLASAKPKRADKSSTPLADLQLVEGDEKGNEMKSLKIELLVAASEDKAIDQAKRLIKKHKGTALEPDLHFRLAELYMRKSKTDRFFEVHRESETVVRLAPRIARLSSSRKSVLSAAETYSGIQKRFPSFPQMDLVVFNHAFARQILDQEREAEALYQVLISKFSRSNLVPDAHLAVGEIAFGKARFAVALEHFNAIQKYPKSRVYPYGLYKAAWTYYNMRDAKRGLAKLEEVVAFGRYVAENKIEARLDLRKEALADMTLFYEDVLPSSGAYAYFLAQAGPIEVGPILLKMSGLYERHSRFNDQRVVLDEFVSKLPNSPLMPKVHMDLVLAYDQLRQKDNAVVRLENFAKICSSQSSWLRGVSKNPKEVSTFAADCTTELNATSLRLAKKWLKAWKKLPADTTYADASEKAFAIFLRTPGSGADYAESRFAYAELLFARKKFRQASVEYAAVSKSGGEVKVSHDASYGALISLEKAVGEKWSTDDEKNFHQLAQVYLAQNPNGQYKMDINYKMALLAYEKERFAEAAPMFLQLGRDYPKHEKGLKSQDLYLDILNIKKDYVGIRDYARELMVSTQDVARSQKMRKLFEQAFFLQAQYLEEKAQFKEALAEYSSFIKQNANSEFTEKATWNAMQLHYKLEDAWNGSRAAEDFATRFPKSPQAINALLRAAQTFEQMAQLGEAARVVEKLAGLDTKATQRWLELAADFHALSGSTAKAQKLYGELRTADLDQKKRTQLLEKINSMVQMHGTETAKVELNRKLVEQGIQPYAGDVKVKAVEDMLQRGNQTEAFNQARQYLGSSSLSRNQKAKLRMVQAKILEFEFRNQSVKSRVDRVATVLALKTEKLQKVQEALQSVIKYGDPSVSLEAFEKLYSCYNHYVTALKEMPIPAGVSEPDAQAFRSELEQLVIPLEEKSVDTLAQAVEFARKQTFLDGRAARLEAMLAKVNQQSTVEVMTAITRPGVVVPLLAGGR